MIRTQIQLTEQQIEGLREVARREKLSISEVIRRALDETLAASASVSRAELMRRAAEVAGRFASGHSDVSVEHDQYLAEAFR